MDSSSKYPAASLLVKNFFFYEGKCTYCGNPIELTFAIHEYPKGEVSRIRFCNLYGATMEDFPAIGLTESGIMFQKASDQTNKLIEDLLDQIESDPKLTKELNLEQLSKEVDKRFTKLGFETKSFKVTKIRPNIILALKEALQSETNDVDPIEDYKGETLELKKYLMNALIIELFKDDDDKENLINISNIISWHPVLLDFNEKNSFITNYVPMHTLQNKTRLLASVDRKIERRIFGNNKNLLRFTESFQKKLDKKTAAAKKAEKAQATGTKAKAAPKTKAATKTKSTAKAETSAETKPAAKTKSVAKTKATTKSKAATKTKQ